MDFVDSFTLSAEELNLQEEEITNLSILKSPNATDRHDDHEQLDIPYAVIEALIAMFAVIGNAFVIIVFLRERRLRKRTNYYILSLALADFMVGLVGIPFAILVRNFPTHNLMILKRISHSSFPLESRNIPTCVCRCFHHFCPFAPSQSSVWWWYQSTDLWWAEQLNEMSKV